MDMESQGAASNARYGLVAIGNFTKIAEVAPIKDRTPEAIIDGLKKMFTSMGNPKQLYSDEESSMRFAKVNRFLSENEIKSVQAAIHALAVERFIRTFKDDLYRRLDSLSEGKTKWITHKGKNINIYSSIGHSIIQIKSNEAGKKKTTFGLTGIFEMQPRRIETTLI